MELKIFSIRDQKSEVFNTPWYKTTHGEAERDFRSAVNDEKTFLYKHPEDFDLYFLGTYDDNTGKFQTLPTPEHVIKAIHCITKEHPGAQHQVPMRKARKK